MPSNKNDKRFQRFRNLFRELNITRNLGEVVENWTYPKLDETNRVANIIKQKINSRCHFLIQFKITLKNIIILLITGSIIMHYQMELLKKL